MSTVQVSIAVVYCLFAAGIVFGYAAIKPVLIREGVYSDFCTPEESKGSQNNCYEQELRYSGSSSQIERECSQVYN